MPSAGSMLYVQSRWVGDRVVESITRFVGSKLKLKVNREEERDRPSSERRRFLSYAMTFHMKSSTGISETLQGESGRDSSAGVGDGALHEPRTDGETGMEVRPKRTRPQWGAGASHMKEALIERPFFCALGFVSLRASGSAT